MQNNNPENQRASLDSKGAIQKAGNIDIFNANVCRKKCVFLQTLDKKQAKRTARQEIQLQPVYTKLVGVVKGNTAKGLLFAFKPFTLSDAKRLKIQTSEKSGGRNLILLIKARKLLRARLPE